MSRPHDTQFTLGKCKSDVNDFTHNYQIKEFFASKSYFMPLSDDCQIALPKFFPDGDVGEAARDHNMSLTKCYFLFF